MTSIKPPEVLGTFTADPTITDNEKAYDYWMKIILEDIPSKFDLKARSNSMSINFRYNTLKKRNIIDKALSRRPLEKKEFTTPIFGATISAKGDTINFTIVDTPILFIFIDGINERRFLNENPVDDQGDIILGQCTISGNGMRSFIEIFFIDIISITITKKEEV